MDRRCFYGGKRNKNLQGRYKAISRFGGICKADPEGKIEGLASSVRQSIVCTLFFGRPLQDVVAPSSRSYADGD